MRSPSYTPFSFRVYINKRFRKLKKHIDMNPLFFGGAASYVALSMLWSKLDMFIFHPGKTIEGTPATINVDYEELNISHDDLVINAWFMRGGGDKVILFSHGNAGTMSDRLTFIRFWNRYLKGTYSLMLYDYPGFGKSVQQIRTSSFSTTSPTVALCKKSLKTMVTHLNYTYPSDKIMMYGESIGGGITATVVAEYVEKGIKFDKVVLQSTFSALHDMIVHFFVAATPLVYLAKDSLDVLTSIKRMKELGQKVLIMHSKIDEIVPWKMYEKMLPHATETLELQGGHNNTILDRRVAEAILL